MAGTISSSFSSLTDETPKIDSKKSSSIDFVESVWWNFFDCEPKNDLCHSLHPMVRACQKYILKERQELDTADANVLMTNETKKIDIYQIEDTDEDEDIAVDKTIRMRASLTCLNTFLIMWHAMFLILFLLLLAVGIVLRLYFPAVIEDHVREENSFLMYSKFVKFENIPDVLEFGGLTNVLIDTLIVLSSLYIFCILCYMTFLLHRVTISLPLVVILSGVIILVEVNIINIYMSPASAANEDAKTELINKAQTEYEVDSDGVFSVTYDLVAVWGKCCGIIDQYDFQNVLLKYYLSAKKEHKALQVPLTCCKANIFEKGQEAVVDCAVSAEGINSVGCYQVIYMELRKYCNLFSIVIVLQLMDVCVHIVLYKKHLSLLKLKQSDL